MFIICICIIVSVAYLKKHKKRRELEMIKEMIKNIEREKCIKKITK